MADALDRGREFFGRHAWADAFAELSAADRVAPLELEDLERLAVAAYLVGADGESDDAWLRAHHEYLRRGEVVKAARCAGWLAQGLLLRGEIAQGGGWLARAQRLLDEGHHDDVGRGICSFRSRFSPLTRTRRLPMPRLGKRPVSACASATGT